MAAGNAAAIDAIVLPPLSAYPSPANPGSRQKQYVSNGYFMETVDIIPKWLTVVGGLTYSNIETVTDTNLAIRNLRKPTIAGLRGHVVLGGLMTALMCDLVIAEESTNLWNPSLRHAGTGGEVMVLPWDIGVRKTKLLLWTEQGPGDEILYASMLPELAAQLARCVVVCSPRLAPLLRRATPLIGHQQIRNRGTLGGSVCHADPASEYPAVLVAAGAELDIASASATGIW